MRVEMPSKSADGKGNNWIEIRTELKAPDRFAVQEVASVTLSDNGNKVSMLAMTNDMRNALLGRIITAWSYPVPIPSQNSFQAADIVIGNALDLDDYAVLEKEVQPLMDKIEGRSLPDEKKASDS
jgi:hypothetical protein